ncbi:cysteine methyltransferase [Enterococcus sp. JM4C]|uniref:methylated-DNA--[protein]-cysteine S-methyltransferase n=1 Tax=Candidatus Enterococcus huntleyi TaxID=1857217 RepID=UPI0013794FE9|nr:methylated-DNA--[protein]-cysteine S-methyltransferase [Enterococcus sp. JM4C]KAF1298316.1 cysteine methyltransferase [Enterococcus sp. JM4C]
MKIQLPIGEFWLTATDKGLSHASFVPLLVENEDLDNPYLIQAKEELLSYFNKERTQFTVPFDIQEGTAFQRATWQALCTIPYGETRSYQEIAEKIGNAKAVRAIGQANHRNPLAIFIPCHRVIGKNGQLTGYMGLSGIELKKSLLTLEGIPLP